MTCVRRRDGKRDGGARALDERDDIGVRQTADRLPVDGEDGVAHVETAAASCGRVRDQLSDSTSSFIGRGYYYKAEALALVSCYRDVIGCWRPTRLCVIMDTVHG